MTLLLDTYAIIELFRGSEAGEQVRKLIEKDLDIYLSVLSVYEIGTVLDREIGEKKSKEYLASIETHYTIIEVSEEIAHRAIKLRSKYKLPAIDCMIYASAQHIGGKVVSGCKHFKQISNQKDVIIV